jgi:hypothetical protein
LNVTVVDLQKVKDEIIGLRPVYTDIGNATLRYLQEGEMLDPRGLPAVLASLVAMYAIDLTAQRRQLEKNLDRKAMLPFYLEANRVFVPLKMRKPLAGKDSANGYLDVRCMGDVLEQGRDGSVLPLKDGRRIEIFSRRSTVESCRDMGRRLLDVLQMKQMTDPGEKIIVDMSLYLHHTIKRLEQRLERIEEMIAESDSRYQ